MSSHIDIVPELIKKNKQEATEQVATQVINYHVYVDSPKKDAKKKKKNKAPSIAP